MKLQPEHLTAIIDTREQWPVNLSPMKTIRETLQTGDYSIQGMQNILSVERKSLPDLISCMTTGRERFEKELQRLRAYPIRCVVVEGTWTDLEQGNYRSQLNPKAATHTIASWMSCFNIPFHFVGDHDAAGRFISYFLFTSAKRLVNQLGEITQSMQVAI